MSIRKQYITDCANPDCDTVVELTIAHKLQAEKNNLVCQCGDCESIFFPSPTEITRIESTVPFSASVGDDPPSPGFGNGLPTFRPPNWDLTN
jgi:hypothetical protein